MIEKEERKYIIGIEAALKKWGFGRRYFFELIKLGLPVKIILGKHHFSVKKVDEFLEKM